MHDIEASRETAKLRLRSSRVYRAIQFVAGEQELDESDRMFIEPFLSHFPEIVDWIQGAINDGVSVKDIAQMVLTYDFIYPSQEMSEQIIMLRAIKHFLLEHNLHLSK